MKMVRNISIVLVSVIMFISASSLTAEGPFIVKKDGKKIMAKSILADSNGVLTIKTGSMTTKLKPRAYRYARIPMPAEVKTAGGKYKAKRYADATRAFDLAYKKYRYLGWDAYCVYYAAKSFEHLKKRAELLKRVQLLPDVQPSDPDKVVFWLKAKQLEATVLIEDKKLEEAGKVLDAIAKGTDQSSAMFANNAKGDILTSQGNESEALFMYMRNLILFPQDKSKEFQKALDRVVEILKAQQNPQAAEYEKMK